MKILKFGGSSLASPFNVEEVANIIIKATKESEKVAVVVSAFGGATDSLIEMGHLAARGENRYLELFDELEVRHINAAKALVADGELRDCIFKNIKDTLSELADILHGAYLVKELSPRTLDFVMSFGELLSAYILSEAIKNLGGDAEFLDTRRLIKTDNSFGKARVYFDRSYQNIQEFFEGHERLQIATGFIASTFQNETTTLERGGSDYTAALLGCALSASCIEIWTDVDGVMTADPRKVCKAFPISTMTYEEAMEMSHFGARVLHPPTMHPAVEKEIPIHIHNTFSPSLPGTIISSESKSNGHMIKGISSIDHIALLRIQGGGMIGIAGIAQRLFTALARKKVNIILITQASSEHSICIAVEPEIASVAKREIEEEFSLEIYAHQIDEVVVEDNLSIVAVVGENMRQFQGIAGRLFSTLGKNGVNVIAIAQGSSELNISIVIKKSDELKSLNVLHDAFFFSGYKPLHLFIIGTGRIGNALIDQIHGQKEVVLERHRIDMRVIGLANSRKMLFDEEGLDLKEWSSKLDQSFSQTNMHQFVQKMKDLNLRNTIFVDCTSDEGVVSHYSDLLQSRISVVTPNKLASSGTYKQYSHLKEIVKKCGVNFLYETNVGAALPVIQTLNDLLCSGDKIHKIEAILSGTLSYICNSVSSSKLFSHAIREAFDNGFTEPDPRKDLNSLDVLKKLLILSRECGHHFELSDIELENFIPSEYFNVDSVEEFFDALPRHDAFFEEKRARVEKEGKALRYVALLEGGHARIAWKEVGPQHPFFHLSGSDNMISFTTDRYKHNPLVIRGPGAGAQVTAAGVFADIMRVSHE